VVINTVGCPLLTGSQLCVGISEATEITSLILQSDPTPSTGVSSQQQQDLQKAEGGIISSLPPVRSLELT
jgi:spore coat protein CotF